MSVIKVNLPDSVSEKLGKVARNKVEVERFVAIAVAEKLGYLEERAERADFDDFEKILAKIPAVKAEEFDKL